MPTGGTDAYVHHSTLSLRGTTVDTAASNPANTRAQGDHYQKKRQRMLLTSNVM